LLWREYTDFVSWAGFRPVTPASSHHKTLCALKCSSPRLSIPYVYTSSLTGTNLDWTYVRLDIGLRGKLWWKLIGYRASGEAYGLCITAIEQSFVLLVLFCWKLVVHSVGAHRLCIAAVEQLVIYVQLFLTQYMHVYLTFSFVVTVICLPSFICNVLDSWLSYN